MCGVCYCFARLEKQINRNTNVVIYELEKELEPGQKFKSVMLEYIDNTHGLKNITVTVSLRMAQ